MTAAAAWERRLRRTLADDDSGPMLVLVAGAAGTGKTRLLQRLAGLPETEGADRVRWLRSGEPLPDVSAERPVLLLADDVHRTGPDGPTWLRPLLEHPSPGLAVVVAYRPEELARPGLPLGAPPPRYAPELTMVRHRIRPWTLDQVRQAATAVLPDRCTPDAVTRLHRRTGGVAQVVMDVLDVLRDGPGKRCTAAEVDAAEVPVRLAELTLGRTAALPREHRTVVWAAAVLDEPATREELTAVAGLAPEQGRAALLAALEGAALAEAGEGRYRLPVPLAARAVRQTLPGLVRQELHARAADVLAGRQPAPWASLSEHRRHAGNTRGWVRAAEQAARQAAEEGRHQEAIRILEQTLASPYVPQQAHGRLAPILARSAVLGLRSDQTIEVLSQVVRDEALPKVMRGELRLDLGLLMCNQAGMGLSAWTELEEAAAELREERPDLAARAMSALIMPHWPTVPLETHLAWGRRAEEAASASGSEAARAAVAANRTSLAMCHGDPQAWRMLQELPTDSPDRQVLQHAARGVCNAADAALWLGHYDRAADLLSEGLELSAKSGAEFVAHTGLGARLLLQWCTGDWTGLAGRCEAFVTETADMPLISADARVVLGLLALAQGEWSRAAGWLTDLGSPPHEEEAVQLLAAARGGLIRLALARDDVEGAADQARRAWAPIAEKELWVWAAELAPWAVAAVARAGDLRRASAMTDAFAGGLTGLDAPTATAALAWTRAALAETSGSPSDAVAPYREAAQGYAAMRRPYAQAVTAEAAARCALEPAAPDLVAPDDGDAGGDGTAWAMAELTSCVQRFTDLGAVWDATRARAELRRHPAAEERRPRGRPGYGDRLSPREREVAELAASGLTNREIAATMHLSHRTVEQHVARAVHKLGATSRQELAGPDAGTAP